MSLQSRHFGIQEAQAGRLDDEGEAAGGSQRVVGGLVQFRASGDEVGGKTQFFGLGEAHAGRDTRSCSKRPDS